MKPTPEQFAAFCAQFDFFNAQLFGGALAPVILNFSRKSGAAGFFGPERWERAGGKSATHEISVNPDTLMQPARDTAQTLVHEMVHLWQHDHGKPSRAGYHNKEWARKMREVGLEPVSLDGGEGTGQRVSDRVIEGGRFALAFERMPPKCLIPYRCRAELQRVVRGGAAGGESEGEDGGGSEVRVKNKIKYSCPECGANVWGKPSLRIACEECEVSFEEQG